MKDLQMTDLDYSRTKLKWNGWGWEGKSFHLGDEDREEHFGPSFRRISTQLNCRPRRR